MAEYLDIEEIERANLDFKENQPPTSNKPNVSKGKKPSSAYQIFIKSLRHDKAFQDSLASNKREFLQAASTRWNELSDTDKQKYINEAQRQKEAYTAYLQEKDHDNDNED